jgi:hypothetical protein
VIIDESVTNATSDDILKSAMFVKTMVIVCRTKCLNVYIQCVTKRLQQEVRIKQMCVDDVERVVCFVENCVKVQK